MKLEELKKYMNDPEIDYSKIKTVKKDHNILTKAPLMKRIMNRIKEKYRPDKTVIVNIELTNGMFKSFIVVESDRGFKYKGGYYLFDEELKYYILDAKMFAYDYHEEYVLPVKRKIPMADIKKALNSKELKGTKLDTIEYASNPLTLERFIQSKVIEGIMRGQQLDEILRQIRLILIIVGTIAIIHFLLYAQKSGVFDQIRGSLPI